MTWRQQSIVPNRTPPPRAIEADDKKAIAVHQLFADTANHRSAHYDPNVQVNPEYVPDVDPANVDSDCL